MLRAVGAWCTIGAEAARASAGAAELASWRPRSTPGVQRGA
jgi:hypothetical protein